MIDRLCWLHVSDFHFQAGADQFSQTVACNALLKDVPDRVAENGPVDFILVTGDVAFSGQAAEYEQAADFMHKLAEATSVDISRFFFVPGNHDVDRQVHEFAHVGAVQLLSSQQEVDRALGDVGRIADLVARQAAYRDFLATLALDQDRIETQDSLGYVTLLRLGVLRIAVVGLNSSWLSGGDRDISHLVIGERQVTNALDLVRSLNPHLTIAMAHHPIEWLASWDQQSCRNVLLPYSHFFHRGHMHEADVTTSPHHPCIVIAAGSSHASRFYPNSYNLIALNLVTSLSTIHVYTYKVDTRSFEHHSSIDTPCRLFEGKLPWTGEELASAIDESAPSFVDISRFMAALLLGQKDELPIRINGKVAFVSSQLAREAVPEQAEPAIAFLGLRNLLMLHDPTTPLADRLAGCADLVRAFGAYLSDLTAIDGGCRARIADSARIELTTTKNLQSSMPQTRALLATLRNEQEWDLLEIQARRNANHRDGELARDAKAGLLEALMHSDEGLKRSEAVRIASELIDAPEATVDDYMLAAGALEIIGQPTHSVQLVMKALLKWPGHGALHTYGRDLATRSGNVALRSALEAARGGS